MDWKNDCAAVIPCFNEAAHIGTLVAELRIYFNAVIVVDDGSSDVTTRQAEQAGAKVIRLPKNFGKGYALHQGWLTAKALNFSWVLMLDGDGQHATTDIPQFLNCATLTGASLIVGNRLLASEKIPPLRRFVNRWMSRRISRLAGQELPDTQCGFRLAKLSDLLAMPMPPHRFEIESAMLVTAAANGQRIKFVPIKTIYGKECSKIHPVADTFRWIRWRWFTRATISRRNVAPSLAELPVSPAITDIPAA